jgi:hypothetical protein
MADVVLDTWTALIAACQAVTGAGQPLAGVKVYDGPQTREAGLDKETLYIGLDIDPAGMSAEGANVGVDLPGIVDSQTFAILCTAESWSGAPNSTPTRRANVFAYRAAVEGIIRPTGGTSFLGVAALASAAMGAWSIYQVQSSRGPYCGLTFRVECQARPSTT